MVSLDIRATPPPWTEVFVELAVRAMLRVHHEYLAWGTTQQWLDQANLSELNSGPGVAFADEVTVCSAVSQEFVQSRYSSGRWVEGTQDLRIKEGPRHYRLRREYPYQSSAEKADFRCSRVGLDGKTLIDPPTLIEAKRAFRWSTRPESTQPVAVSADDVTDTVPKYRTRLEWRHRSCRATSSIGH